MPRRKPATHCKDCGEQLTALNTCYIKTSINPRCRPCHSAKQLKYYHEHGRDKSVDRRYMLQRRYGITPEEYDKLNEIQGGRCAVCGMEEENGVALAVDHDHVTDQIRGLLCKKCNLMVSMIDENENILFAMIKYLRKYKMKEEENVT